MCARLCAHASAHAPPFWPIPRASREVKEFRMQLFLQERLRADASRRRGCDNAVRIDRLCDHQLFSKDNRRLVVLLMFQALRRDESIQVTCHIAAPDQEFHQKRDTQTDGLSISPRVAHASSKHLGADLFEPAAQAQQMNMRLARKISRKHNADHLGVQFLQKVKRKLSTSRDNADTLTWTSTGQSTRGCSRSPRRDAYRQFKHTATVAKRSRDAQASASEGAHEVEPPWKRRKHYQYSPKANELMSLVQDPLVDEHLILDMMHHISREDLVTVRDNFRGAGFLYYAAGALSNSTVGGSLTPLTLETFWSPTSPNSCFPNTTTHGSS